MSTSNLYRQRFPPSTTVVLYPGHFPPPCGLDTRPAILYLGLVQVAEGLLSLSPLWNWGVPPEWNIQPN